MLVIVGFLFLSALSAPQVHGGELIGTLHNPEQYLAAVVDALWAKIKEHGISNLPVPDMSVLYNFSALRIELTGTISFEDGFVQDIDLISLDSQGRSSTMTSQQAKIGGSVLLNNLRLYSDLRADLTTGMKVGTVVITPTTCKYKLSIVKVHGNNTVVPILSYDTDSKPVWEIHPDNLETRLIRRLFQQHANHPHADIKPELIGRATISWIPLFTEFLNEIVTTIEFPDIIV